MFRIQNSRESLSILGNAYRPGHVPRIDMVSYQRWTSIAFDEARRQGMQSSQENSQDLISVVADVWNDRKEELDSATIGEATEIARSEITIR